MIPVSSRRARHGSRCRALPRRLPPEVAAPLRGASGHPSARNLPRRRGSGRVRQRRRRGNAPGCPLSQSTPGGMTTTFSGGTSYRSTSPCFAQFDHATSQSAWAKHDRFRRHLIRSMRGAVRGVPVVEAERVELNRRRVQGDHARDPPQHVWHQRRRDLGVHEEGVERTVVFQGSQGASARSPARTVQ